jgi:hypothetical protein
MRIEAICRLPETPWIAVGTEFPDKQSATVNQSPSITIMEFTCFQTGISDRGARK